VVGRREDLAVTRVELEDVRFIDGPPPGGGLLSCEARLRYRTRPVPAVFGEHALRLAEPFSGAAPGQAAVMYRGTRVLGGGVIRAAA
jgi:tRNA-specific 2-thiouridylase